MRRPGVRPKHWRQVDSLWRQTAVARGKSCQVHLPPGGSASVPAWWSSSGPTQEWDCTSLLYHDPGQESRRSALVIVEL